ncbi:DUF2569 family protein [Ensifer aridi]|uniref:DUF2569 family protein n=1 Tax=Ensifer aridi TaxID=1708715 RepID=UPI000A0F4E63|nr:DUF2569 family protein [Ensifer aridi]
MGSFSIWHWVIVLFFVGMIVLIVRTGQKKVDPVKGPIGFGGWLMLLAIGQTLAPLRTLVETANGMEAYGEYESVPGGQLVATGEPALNFAFLALQVVVLWSMLKKNKSFPQLFLYQWIAIPVVVVLDILLVSAALGIGVNQLLTQDVVSPAIASFIGTGLWTLYVFKSVRVRNTFVN